MVNWGLANQGGFQNALAQGLQMGQMMRERAEEKEYKNALAGYDPANPDTIKPVMAADPRLGIQLQRDAAQRQQQQQQSGFEGLTKFRPLLERAAQGPEQWAQAYRAGQQAGFDMSKVPQQYDPDWANGQLMILELAEKKPELLTNTAKEVMLSLPPEHRNPESPVFVEAMGRALERMVSYQAGGGVAAVNPATGQTRQIVQPGPSIAAPVPYDPNQWEEVGGGGGNATGGF